MEFWPGLFCNGGCGIERQTNDTTELAKERNRQAAERTLTTWIGSSLLLIGFGTALEEIPIALQRSLPQNSFEINSQLSYIIGSGTITFGIAFLIPVAIAHQLELRSLEREDYLTQSLHIYYLPIMVGLVILFGLVVLAIVILVISQQ